MSAVPLPRSRPDRNTATRAVLAVEYEQLATEAHHKADDYRTEARRVWNARDVDFTVRNELLTALAANWRGIARAFEDAAAEERQRAMSDGWTVDAIGGAA